MRRVLASLLEFLEFNLAFMVLRVKMLGAGAGEQGSNLISTVALSISYSYTQ